MSETMVVSDADRLPWLTDNEQRKNSGGKWALAGLLLIALLLVAGVSFWLGMNGLPPQLRLPQAGTAPEVTLNVPPAASVESRADEQPMPEVSPAPVPAPIALPQQADVRPDVAVAPPVRRVMRNAASARVVHRSRPARRAAPAKSEEKPDRLAFSNPWESTGASGKMVRVGTYSSLQQGKQAWSRLAKVFPAMKRLPAVVTDLPSLRNNKVYYRLQIGTTSQAHSEVLCQRMRAIGQSCVVVDLAGARKGNWDDGQPVGL